MFVYIFCIMWATLFVFLAEQQFKKVPVEDKQNSSKSRFVLRKKKQKDVAQNSQSQQSNNATASQAQYETAKPIEKIELPINKNKKIDLTTSVVVLPKDQNEQKNQEAHNQVVERNEVARDGSVSRGRRIIEIMQYSDKVESKKENTTPHVVGNEISRKKKVDDGNRKIGKKVINAREVGDDGRIRDDMAAKKK